MILDEYRYVGGSLLQFAFDCAFDMLFIVHLIVIDQVASLRAFRS